MGDDFDYNDDIDDDIDEDIEEDESESDSESESESDSSDESDNDVDDNDENHAYNSIINNDDIIYKHLTKFELVAAIANRAKQISLGAPPNINYYFDDIIDINCIEAKIAICELLDKKIPIEIYRNQGSKPYIVSPNNLYNPHIIFPLNRNNLQSTDI